MDKDSETPNMGSLDAAPTAAFMAYGGGKKDDDFLATSKNQGLRCFSFLQIVAVTSCFRLLKIEMR